MLAAAPNFWLVGLGFLAGLGLFLVGVYLMSEALKAVAGDSMKRLIARFTTNRFLGVLTGIVATALLDSSSAVAIIVVGLVHAKAMTFAQAVGVVMGANIGTTVSSQLYASGAAEYGWVLLAPGLLRWLGSSEKRRQVGGVFLGLGLLFAGLNLIERSAEPLREYQPFLDFMKNMADPLLGVLAGAVGTALIQSSSAMMGVLIGFLGQGAISIEAAGAMMLGAEIGTCLDVLVASAGRSREALRVGLFQLGFNLASVALFVGLIGPLLDLAKAVAGGDPKTQLATAHVLFNVGSVLAFVWFTGPIAKVLTRLIPDKGDDTNAPAGGAES